MKARVIITDEKGNTFEGEVELSQGSFSHKTTKKEVPKGRPRKLSSASVPASIDFDLHVRPFMKKHVRGMSGPKKFTLLLAHMAKGKTTNPIELSEIEKQWNKMTRLMGGKFNRAYPNRAGDDDLAVTVKKGSYILRPNWTKILTQ